MSFVQKFSNLFGGAKQQGIAKGAAKKKLAAKAKNDIIYVQDDDCFVNHQELLCKYNGRLTNSMTPHHFQAYKDTGATLVGWGCFFPK